MQVSPQGVSGQICKSLSSMAGVSMFLRDGPAISLDGPAIHLYFTILAPHLVPHMHFQVAAVHFDCQAQNAMAGGYQTLTLLQAVEGAIKEEGWQTVMLLRLSPILPFALLNYALSVTPISSWTYIWASAVGIIPGAAGDPASLSQHLLQWLNSLRAFCRTVQAALEIHSHV